MSNGDKEKLWAMLVWNGGRVAQSLTTPGITHIITPYWITANVDHCEVSSSIVYIFNKGWGHYNKHHYSLVTTDI